MRVTVIGCGRLGAPYAAGLAQLGHDVVGLDTNEAFITAMNAGRAPFHEPGLSEALAHAIRAGNLRFTDSYEAAARHADLHFICVPTPFSTSVGEADLSNLYDAFDALADCVDANVVIVGKSSVPVGTAERIQSRLRERVRAGINLEVAWSPDFMVESRALEDVTRPSRIVIGLANDSQRAEPMLRELWTRHAVAGVPIIVTNLETAELVKEAASAYIGTKVAFINVIAEICEATNADAVMLSHCLGLDPRINPHWLHPGVGYGGGCIPKDIPTLVARASQLGLDQEVQLLVEVHRFNSSRRTRTVELAEELTGGVKGKKVAVWGASYKPDVDDIRDSPALDIANQLQRRGASVTVYDPVALDVARSQEPSLDYAASAADAVAGSDLLLHLTGWQEFRQQNPEELAKLARQLVVIDGRCSLDAQRWTSAGWTYRAIGHSPAHGTRPQIELATNY